MADPIKRRNFIKSASLLGASVALANPGPGKIFLQGNEEGGIKNDFFSVLFDKKKGTINIYRSNGTPLITGATACINTNTGRRSISSGKFQHRVNTTNFSDQLGRGKRLLVYSKDPEGRSDLETQISLYDHLEAITAEAICRNVTEHDLVLNSLEPLRVLAKEGAVFSVPAVSKCITNGEMYFDTGLIHQFGTNKDSVAAGEIKGIRLSNNTISAQNETIHSWWNAGLFSDYDKEGMVLGYLENNLCLGNLLISKTAADQISFLTESVYAPELILKPGKTCSSNRLMINIAANPYLALENYAAAVGKVNNDLGWLYIIP